MVDFRGGLAGSRRRRTAARSTARLLSLFLAAVPAACGPSGSLGRIEAAEPAAAASPIQHGFETPMPFEGLGLGGFDGVGSIASELRAVRDRAIDSEAWALGMSVTGPGRTSRGGWKLSGEPSGPSPLKALVNSKVQGVDVTAGLDADAETIQSGPARWIGGVKVATQGSRGRAELAVNTSVRHLEASRLIGVELGPRYERSLPGGLTFFLDGKASAETAPSVGERLGMPSSSLLEGFGSLGVTGRTGFVR